MGKAKKATPQKRTIRVHRDALQDLADINFFIGITQQQPLNAIKVSEALENAIDRIALSPFAYKECEQLQTKTKIYRQAICFSWIIIYKITTIELVILGVVHGSRHPSRLRKLRGKK